MIRKQKTKMQHISELYKNNVRWGRTKANSKTLDHVRLLDLPLKNAISNLKYFSKYEGNVERANVTQSVYILDALQRAELAGGWGYLQAIRGKLNRARVGRTCAQCCSKASARDPREALHIRAPSACGSHSAAQDWKQSMPHFLRESEGIDRVMQRGRSGKLKNEKWNKLYTFLVWMRWVETLYHQDLAHLVRKLRKINNFFESFRS